MNGSPASVAVNLTDAMPSPSSRYEMRDMEYYELGFICHIRTQDPSSCNLRKYRPLLFVVSINRPPDPSMPLISMQFAFASVLSSAFVWPMVSTRDMESLKLKKMDGATCLNDFQSPFSAHSVGVHFSYVSNTDFAHREYGMLGRRKRDPIAPCGA